MAYYIGIDPGLDGGIAVIGGTGEVRELCATPATRGTPREYLDHEMGAIVHKWSGGRTTRAAIERAQPMPKQGVRSMFVNGLGFGLWRGILAAHSVPFEMPRPQEWRRVLGLAKGADKAASVALAARLFPGAAGDLRGPRGGLRDGLAEALLIAEYARRIGGAQ